MKISINTIKLTALSLYNKIKYRGICSGIKKRSITLEEACKALNVDAPQGISKKAMKAHYFISMKRMFYMKRTLHFTASNVPNTFTKALIKQGGMLVAQEQIGDLPTLVVPNLIEAYITLLSLYRNKFDPVVVAVTGSTGKTSCKNMCISTFKSSKHTFGAKYNMNTYPYCGSLLQCVKNKHKIYVQEVDEGEVGFVAHSSMIIKPNYAVVTNSGISHFKNFTSSEDITRNILGITAGMPQDGKVLINADDKALMNAMWDRKLITVGFTKNADYYATDIKVAENGKIEYIINHNGNKQLVQLSVIGKHNIYNSMFAYAIADDLEFSTNISLKGIKKFKTFGVRQNLIKAGNNLLYVDCFNAAPASMKTAIEAISSIKPKNGGKRVAFLAEMSEFGEITKKVHTEIGEHINNIGGIDVLVTFGETAKHISNAVTRSDIKVIHSNDKNELINILREFKGSNNIIMFKGSRTTKLEELIKGVYPFKYFFKILLADILLFHDI